MDYKAACIVIAILSVMLFSGCTGNRCPEPNVTLRDRCCLDDNNNNFCDVDETTTTTTTTSTTTTTTTTTTTSTTTTTTTTTSSTTSTTTYKDLCGEPVCIKQYVSGECGMYGSTVLVCVNSTAIYDCNADKILSCGKGATCKMTTTGGHCSGKLDTASNNNNAGLR